MKTKKEILREIEKVDNRLTNRYIEIDKETSEIRRKNIRIEIFKLSAKIAGLKWALEGDTNKKKLGDN